MTVITCPRCAAEVPDPAARCPRCGAATSEGRPRRRGRAAGLVFAFVLLAATGVAAFFLIRDDLSAPAPTTLEPAAQFQARVQSTCDQVTADPDAAETAAVRLLSDSALLGYGPGETALRLAELRPAVAMLVGSW
ncbi:MAG: zinc ribbon domain-containing protein [Actinobacteria bacterium]|nr:zinc ribbon domain-containing protein [Actinomycetota bacterium]